MDNVYVKICVMIVTTLFFIGFCYLVGWTVSCMLDGLFESDINPAFIGLILSSLFNAFVLVATTDD